MDPDRRPAAALYVLRPTLGQGGADRVTLTLLEHLDRGAFSPTLVLMRPSGDLLPFLPADVRLVSLGGGRLWTAWWPLLLLLRRHPPKIVFSTSSGTNIIACLARLLQPGARYRLVISERTVLRRPHPSPARRLQRLAKRLLYGKADLAIAVSRGVAEDLAELCAMPREKIRQVASPVVPERLAELAAADPGHPWPVEARPLIMAAGRLQHYKGFDVLLDAMARLEDRSSRLLILGEGPCRHDLEAQAERLGIADRVALPGFDPNPFAAMARASVFVLPSRREGMPGVLVQAMACGAAVIAADCHSGPAEIIDDGVTGLLTPVGDAARLAECIDRLLSRPHERVKMAAAARAAVGSFHPAATMRYYEAALLGTRRAIPHNSG